MNFVEDKLNVIEAERALTEKPVFASEKERILILNELKDKYLDDTQPVRFAKIMDELLQRVSVPITKHDLIAGRVVHATLSLEEERIFQQYLSSPRNLRHGVLIGSGHCVFSWNDLVSLGLCGLVERAEKRLLKCKTEQEKTFVSSMLSVYGSIKKYILRYAQKAKESGLEEVADNLRKCATKKPSSFYEAMQLLWIITLVFCSYHTPNPTLTLGRMDQILYPLYKSDLENGRITAKKAKEIITDYYCKHNLTMGRGEHQVGDKTNSSTFDRINNFDSPQYLLLAGTNESGKPACNELTLLFAECINPKFKNPVVVVRYFKDMDTLYPRLWATLTKKALDSSALMFYNDDNVIKTFMKMGLPEEDARKYAHFGCNWPTTGDNGAWMTGGPNSKNYDAFESEEEKKDAYRPYMRSYGEYGWVQALMDVLRDLCARKGDDFTMEDIYSRFFSIMSDFIDDKLEWQVRELTRRKRFPSKILCIEDCFISDSIENAQCHSACAKYHFELQAFQFFATIVDCFTAVEQLVLIEKKVSLKTLLDACDADFVGYERVLALCRNAQKFGQEVERADYHAHRLAKSAFELVTKKNEPYLKKYGLMLVPCMQSDTWHLKYGEKFGASVDGRRKGQVFSQNTKPTLGVCVNGLTAMLNSMLSIPSDSLLSGALNLDISSSDFEGENGRKNFSALMGSYFNRGGLHAQVSCAKREELIDAQKNPDAHRDLRVRITGYSGIFVDIDKRLQEDVIRRFE